MLVTIFSRDKKVFEIGILSFYKHTVCLTVYVLSFVSLQAVGCCRIIPAGPKKPKETTKTTAMRK